MTTVSSTQPDPSAGRFTSDAYESGARHRLSPILVAVSGEPDGSAPVRIAAALSARHGSVVSALQVLDTTQIPAPLPYAFGLAREMVGDTPYEADVSERRRQFARWLGREVDWPVVVEVGSPASAILKYAEGQHAALIVSGLRRHGLIDRVLRDETTLNVARRAHAIVLGVVPSLHELPRRAVVGVDFGPASVRAARAALDVLAASEGAGESPTLCLLYVDRESDTREGTAGEEIIARLGVAAAFDELKRELQPPAGVRIESMIGHGEPAKELLAYADETGADLIAVGSVRHERLDQWLLGSVTTAIVRDGRCSVLIIPPPDA